MNRTLAIIFSVLVVLLALILVLVLSWGQYRVYQLGRLGTIDLCGHILLLIAGSILIAYHVHFLFRSRSSKNLVLIEKRNAGSKRLNKIFPISAFTFIALLIFSFALTLSRDGDADLIVTTVNIVIAVILLVFAFMNWYVWAFAASMKKESLIDNEIERIGERGEW